MVITVDKGTGEYFFMGNKGKRDSFLLFLPMKEEYKVIFTFVHLMGKGNLKLRLQTNVLLALLIPGEMSE